MPEKDVKIQYGDDDKKIVIQNPLETFQSTTDHNCDSYLKADENSTAESDPLSFNDSSHTEECIVSSQAVSSSMTHQCDRWETDHTYSVDKNKSFRYEIGFESIIDIKKEPLNEEPEKDNCGNYDFEVSALKTDLAVDNDMDEILASEIDIKVEVDEND